MLVSAIVRLSALQPADLPCDQGRAVSAEFISWLAAANPALVSRVHDPDMPHPYTVSSLRGLHPGRDGMLHLQAGQPLFFRITTFHPDLSRVLLDTILPALDKRGGDEPLCLGGVPFRIDGTTTDPDVHPWARMETIESLVQRTLLAARQPRNTIRVVFASPTTFRSNDKHLPFPLPELVFDSWLRRWNAFATLGLPLPVKEVAREHLALSRFRLESQAVRMGAVRVVGFSGACVFRLMHNDPYWLRLMHTLAAYAFYCGTGHKTAWGLGQTKVLYDRTGTGMG